MKEHIPEATKEFIHKRDLAMYCEKIVPLIENDKYDEAWSLLLKNPGVKDYVHASDWREMCEYFARGKSRAPLSEEELKKEELAYLASD